MPITMPKASGRTTTTKSFVSRPSESLANPGPSTPRTPTSEAAIPRYTSDQAMRRFARMKAMPSRSWPRVEPIASSASSVEPPCGSLSVAPTGGDGGSVQQKPAATR